ncbi:MI domain-containing protein [Plasmodiophora brassicae]|uniref:Uncharacterized protein n=1 Tax=Plasmodiophora brassicae TaxID=37360 RepID=A0A0G4J3F7_PLABS|nr:hypothetical protein PBRA_002342 [Plasmodiophora brassicae]SPQ98930.1 unnamed protein product [Plasmodiophora brassicae]
MESEKVLRERLERLTARMRSQKAAALSALDLAAKTAEQNAAELNEARSRIEALEAELLACRADRDAAIARAERAELHLKSFRNSVLDSLDRAERDLSAEKSPSSADAAPLPASAPIQPLQSPLKPRKRPRERPRIPEPRDVSPTAATERPEPPKAKQRDTFDESFSVVSVASLPPLSEAEIVPAGRSELSQLLSAAGVAETELACCRISAGLSNGSLTLDAVVEETLNSLRTACDSEGPCNRLVDVLLGVAGSRPALIDMLLHAFCSHIRRRESLSDPLDIGIVSCFGRICHATGRVERARVLLFDLMRLNPILQRQAIDVLIENCPDCIDPDNRSCLAEAVRLILADTDADDKFGALAQRAVGLVGDADDAPRAIELMALARGWPWACAKIITPLWDRIRTCTNSPTLTSLIECIGIVSKTSGAEGGQFRDAILDRFNAILALDGASFPTDVQVAAADAVVIMANGQLNPVRPVYRWYISAPDTVRAALPARLREDIQFIGKLLAVR